MKIDSRQKYYWRITALSWLAHAVHFAIMLSITILIGLVGTMLAIVFALGLIFSPVKVLVTLVGCGAAAVVILLCFRLIAWSTNTIDATTYILDPIKGKPVECANRWDEHPDLSRAEWKHERVTDKTKLPYWKWVDFNLSPGGSKI